MTKLIDMRWPWLVAAALLLLVFVSTFFEVRFPGDWDTRPVGTVEDITALAERGDLNVLMLTIDTLRAERLGVYGYERDTSPHLDSLAASGVRFERHLSQSSWTKASMASLWTGFYPSRTGITRYDGVLPEDALMPAEVLRDAGFQTVGLWRNGWVSPTFGFDQGFDVYQRPIGTTLPANLRRENPTLSERGTDESLVEAGLEFLRVSGDRPWFLYMHMMDLHEYVYDADSALFGSKSSDLYDNSIRWTDGTVGFLMEKLAEMGQLDRTLIAIVSDHGEAFLERGIEGHARRVYRETTEVPFLLLFPFRLEPGVVVKTRSQNVDVWPTLFELLGIETSEGSDGRSLVPDILASARGEEPAAEDRIAFAALDQNWAKRDASALPTVAVVDGPHRYIRVQNEGGDLQEQLFDATDDAREVRDWAATDPATLERLRAIADEYYQRKPDWGESPTREIDELELNLLRALGYKIE